MLLRDVEFGSALMAPDLMGAHHRPGDQSRRERRDLKNWQGATLVTPTATIEPIEDLPRRRALPRAESPHIPSYPNSANPGLSALLQPVAWEEVTEPFLLSFRFYGNDSTAEVAQLAEVLDGFQPRLQTQFGLLLDCSADSVLSHRDWERMGELIEADIRLLRTKLDLPLVVYLSAVTPLEILAEIGNLASVDALAIAGPIPLGYRGFNWKSLGISDGDADRPSWLEQPGLVGPACLPFAVDRLHQLRDQGFNLPIIVGNGIMSPADVDHLKHVRGSAVMLGRDIAQDPRAVSGTIKAANRELPATMARMMQAVAPAAPHPR